jgi:hypothetical protein
MTPREEPQDMAMSKEGKTVFKKFCLVGLGFPAVLFAFITAAYLSPWALDRAQVTSNVLNLVALAMAAAALAIWAFFSFLLYRRLWKLFPHVSQKDKGWTYAEATFILLGVGVMIASVLGVFLYVLTGD